MIIIIIVIIIVVIMCAQTEGFVQREFPTGSSPRGVPHGEFPTESSPKGVREVIPPNGISSRKIRGNYLSSATCLTQVFFKRFELCSKVW